MEVRLDEAHALDADSLRGAMSQLQGCPGQVRAHHQPLRAGEEQAELAGAATHLQHGGVAGDGRVQAAGEFAPRRPRAQGGEALAGRVAREGRLRVEAADAFGPSVTGKAQVGNSAWRGVLSGTAIASQAAQSACAAGTGEEIVRRSHTRTAPAR